MRDGCGTDRGKGLDHPAVHAAVYYAVALMVLFAHLPLAAHLLWRGSENHDPHFLHPAWKGVDPGGEFICHRLLQLVEPDIGAPDKVGNLPLIAKDAMMSFGLSPNRPDRTI